MTGQELIDDIRSELVEPVAGFWTDSELLRWINKGEQDFINKVRGVEEVAVLSLEQGRMNYPLPAAWLSEQAIFVNDPQDDGTANWRSLLSTSLNRMKQENPNFLSNDSRTFALPTRFFLWNREIYFWPVPDADGTDNIKMFFKAKAAELTVVGDDLTTPTELTDGIKAYVLWKAWSKEKELELAAEAKNDYLGFVQEGRRWLKKQAGSRINRIDNVSSEQWNDNNNPTHWW